MFKFKSVTVDKIKNGQEFTYDLITEKYREPFEMIVAQPQGKITYGELKSLLTKEIELDGVVCTCRGYSDEVITTLNTRAVEGVVGLLVDPPPEL